MSFELCLTDTNVVRFTITPAKGVTAETLLALLKEEKAVIKYWAVSGSQHTDPKGGANIKGVTGEILGIVTKQSNENTQRWSVAPEKQA